MTARTVVEAAEVEDIPRRYLYALEVCGIR
jgi:hypothetical protein